MVNTKPKPEIEMTDVSFKVTFDDFTKEFKEEDFDQAENCFQILRYTVKPKEAWDSRFYYK
jgi:hypothetical protein